MYGVPSQEYSQYSNNSMNKTYCGISFSTDNIIKIGMLKGNSLRK